MMMTLLLLVAGVNAQKIDQRLTRLVEKSDTRSGNNRITQSPQAVEQQIAVVFNADGTPRSMSAIATLKKGAECPTAQLEQMGIKVRFVLGDMVVLNVPADKLLQLEEVEAFNYVAADEILYPMNDKSREASNVDQAADETLCIESGLPKAYTGQGVVLGIIDQGIDFNHAAFRNDDGSTRIVKVIEYPIREKEEYTSDEEIKALTTDYESSSHGTHVSSAAGGSDLGNGLQGMAPETDLFLCGLGLWTTYSNIVESIKDIFDYATSVGKPAVVNISLGNYLGLHDGSDQLARSIATLTENGTKPGRAVISSCGNAGSRYQSIVKTLSTTDEELKTVLGADSYPTPEEPYLTVSYYYRYMMYADDYQDFTPRMMLVNLKTGELVGEEDLDKVGLDDADIPTLEKKTVVRLNGEEAVTYSFNLRRCEIENEDYRYALIVKAGHDGQTIKMVCNGDTNGEPCFFAPPSVDGSYDFAANGYTNGDGTIAFNTSVCDESVISVGAYVTRSEWTNYLGEVMHNPTSALTLKQQEIGEIIDTSSYGEADNGVRCPTVIAPGKAIISGANNYNSDLFHSNEAGVPDPEDASETLCSNIVKHGRPNWYFSSRGTSMASSMVSGIVALWMQANPNLTVNDIKEVMRETCVNDEWTTDISKIPSHNRLQSGFGKIDALGGLKHILGITTGIETVAPNGHREATPATMYTVDAPVYNMMGQRVDKSQKGFVIYKGRKYVNK